MTDLRRRARLLRAIWRSLAVQSEQVLAVSDASPGASIHPTVRVLLGPGGRVDLQDGAQISAYAVLAAQRDHLADHGDCLLSVGRDSYVGEMANLRAVAGSIFIGERVLISQGVHIVASNHQVDPEAPATDLPSRTDRVDVTVADGAWIGVGAVLLPGVRVGENAVVAANAVVTRDVPAGSLVAGVPAKDIRSRVHG